MQDHSFIFYGIAFFSIILLRYLIAAGGTYIFFYSPFSHSYLNQNRKNKSVRNQNIIHDIKLSIYSSIVFALASCFIMSVYRQGISLLYNHPQEYGFLYLGISYVFTLLLQDTFFYFTHRLFHQPLFFSWFHQGHHRSRYPTPWTSFAFDPLEAIVHALFYMGIIFIIPLHLVTFLAILITMTVWAVLNHIGLDQLPLPFPHNWLGKWFIGPAHHSIHHNKYTLHFGLYFTFWDKLLGTQDPNFESKLDSLSCRN